MRFIIGVLLGYYMRGKKRWLIITLTVYIGFIIMCSVVLPAIALSMLGLSVMRERASLRIPGHREHPFRFIVSTIPAPS
jgi:ABC-type transport system involved in multi-copper enzyme maturation permease subunit